MGALCRGCTHPFTVHKFQVGPCLYPDCRCQAFLRGTPVKPIPTAARPAKAARGLALDLQCELAGLPVPVAEYRFHPTRQWRFDWAWPHAQLAVEVDGGTFKKGGGRHSRGAGYREDCIKLAEAAILGWRVIRALPEHVENGQVISWLIRALR